MFPFEVASVCSVCCRVRWILHHAQKCRIGFSWYQKLYFIFLNKINSRRRTTMMTWSEVSIFFRYSMHQANVADSLIERHCIMASQMLARIHTITNDRKHHHEQRTKYSSLKHWVGSPFRPARHTMCIIKPLSVFYSRGFTYTRADMEKHSHGSRQCKFIHIWFEWYFCARAGWRHTYTQRHMLGNDCLMRSSFACPFDSEFSIHQTFNVNGSLVGIAPNIAELCEHIR